jgi:hypothetical protein
LFEGEGCITRNGTYWQLTVGMTDLDALVRFQDIVGCGRIAERSALSLTKKQMWHWRSTSPLQIYPLLVALWPWLCSRRQAKAQECMISIIA